MEGPLEILSGERLKLSGRGEPFESNTLGGTVLLRAVSGRARQSIEDVFVGVSKEKFKATEFYAMGTFYGLVDEAGSRVFSSIDEVLDTVDGHVIHELGAEVMKRSKMSVEESEKTEKNSDSAPTGDSTSGSALLSGEGSHIPTS